MKHLLLTLAAGALIGLTACSKSGGSIDTAKVEAAFAAVQQADKADLQAALDALKAGNFSGALASLQKAAADVKLTPEQKSALADLVAQVKARAGEAVQQATQAASQAETNLAGKVDTLVKQAGDQAGKAATEVKEAAGDLVKQAEKEAGKAATGLQQILPKP